MNPDLSPHSHISVTMSAMGHSHDADMMEAEDDLGTAMSDDDDSIGDEETFTTPHFLHEAVQDQVSGLSSGSMPGLASTSVGTTRRRQRPYKFETNPGTRKRQHTRLVRKLKQTLHEFCTRCGQQAVILYVSPGKDNPNFKVIGSSPLDQVVRSCQNIVLRDLERVLQEQTPSSSNHSAENKFELPALMIDGIPTPVDKMNQAQLRMFVPEMLKYSTGRGKPGWGKEATRPVWWPLDVPWANVRRDVRTDDQKLNVSWTQALRQIVKNCYKFHGRDDLLHCFHTDDSGNRVSLADRFSALSTTTRPAVQTTQMNLAPPTLVQTVQNSDGSVSLVQLDSGQTIATITQDQSGAAVATLTTQDGSEGPLAVTMHQVNNTHWSIAAADNQPDLSALATTVTEGEGNDDLAASVDQEQTQQVIINPTSTSLHTEEKFHHNSQSQDHDMQHQTSHTIGITFDSSGQAVATLQNTTLPPGSQILLSSHGRALDDSGSSAMVQIPVSVYEKIANSIQDVQIGRSVTQLQNQSELQQDKLDLDTGQG